MCGVCWGYLFVCMLGCSLFSLVVFVNLLFGACTFKDTLFTFLPKSVNISSSLLSKIMNRKRSVLCPFPGSSAEFACLSGDQCTNSLYQCDGEFDCYDGSDEYNCTCELKRDRYLSFVSRHLTLRTQGRGFTE